ncbi:unnamed protein product, partial [Ixodes persulcatus]
GGGDWAPPPPPLRVEEPPDELLLLLLLDGAAAGGSGVEGGGAAPPDCGREAAGPFSSLPLLGFCDSDSLFRCHYKILIKESLLTDMDVIEDLENSRSASLNFLFRLSALLFVFLHNSSKEGTP